MFKMKEDILLIRKEALKRLIKTIKALKITEDTRQVKQLEKIKQELEFYVKRGYKD